MNQNTKNMVDGDKTRRKRLKVVSACGECRRKKTKCNGEKPCAGCLKAHVECKYVSSQRTSTSAITAANATAAASAVTPTTLSAPVSTTVASKAATSTAKSQKMIHPPAIETAHEHTMLNNAPLLTSASAAPSSSTSTSTSHSHTAASSIESIEERLGTIENILRALLGSGKNKQLLQGFHPQQQQQRSESSAYMDPRPPHYYGHHPHYHSDVSSSSNTSTSSSSCGDMYSSPHLVHAPHIQNRPIPREKRQRHEEEEEGMTENKRLNVRDDFGHGDRQRQQQHPYSKLQLAPIKIINHTPGTPTTSIRNLLNEQTDEDQHQKKKPRWYPTSASSTTSTLTTTSSAFYRMSSSPRNEVINSNNSATTAAGNFT
ncbi:hypothetical protein MAM1_0008d00967 [Mucor ambiguus]|uniref:Zn(2)-C6 fungal-type domain-containing protein n=1 Tax=Mucor ambiguus TaxID=91626 RepID=A0A0C9M543_9FUNG|nr:hypothetical protein MAM1_0008d00967 [Mucor ambiguus]